MAYFCVIREYTAHIFMAHAVYKFSYHTQRHPKLNKSLCVNIRIDTSDGSEQINICHSLNCFPLSPTFPSLTNFNPPSIHFLALLRKMGKRVVLGRGRED